MPSDQDQGAVPIQKSDLKKWLYRLKETSNWYSRHLISVIDGLLASRSGSRRASPCTCPNRRILAGQQFCQTEI